MSEQPTALKEHQRAKEEKAGMPALVEALPRQNNKRNQQQQGEHSRSLRRKPAEQKPECPDGDHAQITQHLEGGGWYRQLGAPECREWLGKSAHDQEENFRECRRSPMRAR